VPLENRLQDGQNKLRKKGKGTGAKSKRQKTYIGRDLQNKAKEM